MSNDREFALHDSKRRELVIEYDDALHTVSPLKLWPWTASARVSPRRLRASVFYTEPPCDDSLHSTRDAYDQFLPSNASNSSTRASFVFDEIASRAYGLFRVPHTLPALKRVASPSDEQSNTRRFHDADVAPMI